MGDFWVLFDYQHLIFFFVGNYVHFLAQINDQWVIRAYTPVSSDDDQGFVDFIIKVNNAHLLSSYLEPPGILRVVEWRVILFL